jgi:hypothetical protein
MEIKRAVIICVSLIVYSCSSKKQVENKIELKIENQILSNNSRINVLIINNTRYNYYLPILNSPESEKWKYMLSSKENSFFFLYMRAYTRGGSVLDWRTTNCFDEHSENDESELLDILWENKKKNIGIEDLILIPAGKTVTIDVPVKLHVDISKHCSWEIPNYKKEKELLISFSYSDKSQYSVQDFLTSNTIEKLKKMRYRLYDKSMESNKVVLLSD